MGGNLKSANSAQGKENHTAPRSKCRNENETKGEKGDDDDDDKNCENRSKINLSICIIYNAFCSRGLCVCDIYALTTHSFHVECSCCCSCYFCVFMLLYRVCSVRMFCSNDTSHHWTDSRFFSALAMSELTGYLMQNFTKLAYLKRYAVSQSYDQYSFSLDYNNRE